ncbi:MAG: hypothetical protein ACREFD_03955 [Stellaceae bacterium]
MVHFALVSVAIVALFLGTLAMVNQIAYLVHGDEIPADDNAVDAADQRTVGAP